jgi:uncharacterized membrane protein YgcG
MNDDLMNQRTAGGQELARRLEAYAEARLSPDPAAVSRMRARVMLEARTQLEAVRPIAAVPEPTPIGLARSLRRVRRGAAILLAAALSITVVAGAALAAQAGGPLYNTRLWLEAVTLPTDPAARTTADVRRLEDRLGEATSASREGNQLGEAAALIAYQAVVDDALGAAGTDDALLAKLEETLGKHLTVLNGLLDKVPDQARSGIENAIRNSGKALEKAHGQASQGGGQGGGNPGGGNQGGGNQGGGQGGNPDPARTPKPHRTPSPPEKQSVPSPRGEPAASHAGGSH